MISPWWRENHLPLSSSRYRKAWGLATLRVANSSRSYFGCLQAILNFKSTEFQYSWVGGGAPSSTLIYFLNPKSCMLSKRRAISGTRLSSCSTWPRSGFGGSTRSGSRSLPLRSRLAYWFARVNAKDNYVHCHVECSPSGSEIRRRVED